MADSPLLSIITINYNHREGLEKTFASIFSQTWQEFEFIVIDGGSTDGSKELIEDNQDKIDYWVSEKDKGVYYAMNKGIKAAKGKYLNFMNSGDYFYEKISLEKVVKVIYKVNFMIFYGAMYNLEDKILHEYPEKLTFKTFYYGTISHQSSFINKELFLKYGYYSVEYKIVSDWYFFLKTLILGAESSKYLGFAVSTYEGGGLSSLSTNRDVLLNHKLERQMILDKYFSGFLKDYNYLDDAFYLVKQLRRIGLIQLLQKFGLFKNLDDKT